MESSTIATRTIDIDGMKGDACVQKVNTALKGVPGVSNANVKVGSATLRADESACTAACASIDKAGYTAHATDNNNNNNNNNSNKDNASSKGNALQSDTKPAMATKANGQSGMQAKPVATKE